MDNSNQITAENFVLDLSRRVLEPEEVISSEEAVAYANRKDNRTLTSKLLATDIAEKLSLIKDSKVVEIAGGAGQLAYEIYKTVGCSIVSTDGSPELIAAASERYKDTPIKFFTENLHSHSGEGVYDAVVCKDSFHHFFDSKEALEEMFTLLKSKGKVYIFDLCRDADIEEVRYRADSIKSEHERMRFLRSLNASLKTKEFEKICEAHKLEIYYPLKFSQNNLEQHRIEIEKDPIKESELSTLFAVYIIEK